MGRTNGHVMRLDPDKCAEIKWLNIYCYFTNNSCLTARIQTRQINHDDLYTPTPTQNSCTHDNHARKYKYALYMSALVMVGLITY